MTPHWPYVCLLIVGGICPQLLVAFVLRPSVHAQLWKPPRHGFASTVSMERDTFYCRGNISSRRGRSCWRVILSKTAVGSAQSPQLEVSRVNDTLLQISPILSVSHIISGCWKRGTYFNWSVGFPVMTAPVTRATFRATGVVLADSCR